MTMSSSTNSSTNFINFHLDCAEKLKQYVQRGVGFYRNCYENMLRMEGLSVFGEELNEKHCLCNPYVVEHCGTICWNCNNWKHNIYIVAMVLESEFDARTTSKVDLEFISMSRG